MGVPQGRSWTLRPPLVPPPGLWTGLTICILLQASFYVIFLCRLDWTKASKEVFVCFLLLLLCFWLSCGLKTSFNDCGQAQVRAGIQIKEEKEMTDLEGTSKLRIGPR